jgi:chaperonin cofactor prefoldin
MKKTRSITASANQPVTLAAIERLLNRKLDEKLDERFDQLGSSLQQNFDDIDQRFDTVDKRLGSLEEGQEHIRLRLDNVVYRFELNELNQRVTVLEQKIS